MATSPHTTTGQRPPPRSINLLVGGTPCQSFSVAGLRKGLEDPRGNLCLTFLALVDRLKPRWVLWENVPGVLSSRSGRDFGAFLGALGEIGYGWAYRVLDAQYFGVAQRRRRVFVVGYLGDWKRAAEVLFEPESLSGNPPPSREAGKTTPASPSTSPESGSHWDGADVHPALSRGGGQIGYSNQEIFSQGGSGLVQPTAARMVAFGEYAEDGTASTLKRRDYKDATDLIAFHPTQDPITSDDGTTHSMGCGSSKGQASIAIAIRTANTGANGHGISEDVSHTLDQAQGQAVAAPSIMFEPRCSRTTGGQPQEELSHCLRADTNTGDGSPCVAKAMAVRRLTPVECERLQGFPDHYTAIPWRGKPSSECPDGPRYKALGNSMAVPVMRWIGQRIHQLETL